MPTLPAYVDIEEFAAYLRAPIRTVREKARAIGACRVIGNRTLMTDGDVALFMEAIKPCPSPSTVAAKSGTTTSLLPEGDFEALQALRTKPQRSASRQRKKPVNGSVISMDRRRM